MKKQKMKKELKKLKKMTHFQNENLLMIIELLQRHGYNLDRYNDDLPWNV